VKSEAFVTPEVNALLDEGRRCRGLHVESMLAFRKNVSLPLTAMLLYLIANILRQRRRYDKLRDGLFATARYLI
jgi:hypothetical protein